MWFSNILTASCYICKCVFKCSLQGWLSLLLNYSFCEAERPWGFCGPVGKQVFLFEYVDFWFWFFFSFCPWIQSTSFCKTADSAICTQAHGIFRLWPYSCWNFPTTLPEGSVCSPEEIGILAQIHLTSYSSILVCLKKVASAGCVE